MRDRTVISILFTSWVLVIVSRSVDVDRILQKRIVPVAVIDDANDAAPLAEALQAGGLDLIEVTFRTPAAAAALRNIKKTFPAMLVGAGTLLTTAQIEEARQAGAEFGVAPGLNEDVVRASLKAGLPFIPGVATASEVERALQLGCRLLKLFPADAVGGVRLLKSLAGPYAHTGVKFIPLGGINAGNAAEYLVLPIVAAVGGSWMVERKLIAAKNWSEITALTAAAVKLAAT